MYRKLDAWMLVGTAQGLAARMAERFPDAGLTAVARDLVSVAEQAVDTSKRLARPIVLLRIGAAGATILFICLLIMTSSFVFTPQF